MGEGWGKGCDYIVPGTSGAFLGRATFARRLVAEALSETDAGFVTYPIVLGRPQESRKMVAEAASETDIGRAIVWNVSLQ